MEMLEYCKTYNIMKSSLSNTISRDLSPQKTIIAVENDQESDFCDGGKVVVETIHCLTGKPGDLSLYQSVKRSTKDSENEEKKLSPLKEISRSRTMISTVKGHHKDVLNFESELTFTPKLNALSIKLAKARGEKIRNSALNRRSSYQNAEEDAIFTFKPQVSSNSEKIVQKLKTTFLDRQMLHVEKQKRHIQSDSYLLPYKSSRLSPVQMIRSKKNKTSKLKDLNDSIEEENEDKHNPTPSKDSLLTTSSDITNSLSNSSSSTDIECTKRLNEDQQSNENQMDECDNSDENDNNSLENKKNTRNIKLECLNTGAQRLKEQSPYNQSSENLYLNKHKRSIRAHQRGLTYPVTKPKIENEDWNSSTKVDKKPNIPNGVKKVSHSRNASQPGQHCSKMKYDHPLFEKVRHAKEVADGAIKNKKVFICHGPYPIVRASLRRRGFVEKHYQSSPLIKKKARKKRQNADSDADSASSDDESDDNPTPNTTPRGKVNKSVSKSKETSPKESDNKKDYGGGSDDDSSDDDDDDDSEDEDWKAGYEAGGPDSEFNLMSRMVRNAVASFIWTVRRDDVDFKYLRKDQTVNHFSRAYSFTTKVGLCSNLRNLAFYEEVDPFTFFPRCHRLGVEEDKLDFIDDFRMNAALAIIKWVIARFENSSSASGTLQTNDEPSIVCEDKQKEDEPAVETTSGNILPVKALTSSLEACRDYLRRQEHLDVDDPLDTKPVISEVLWNEIINYSYQLRQSQTVIASAFPFLHECQNVVNKMKEHMPQIDIDGQRNIWIVKPGAKSRGRGIMCMDRLEDILKLTGNIIGQKEGRWVVQKYIERPLLIYGVKFDIRQWYLVTDWNPLTVWFYQDCYLRFCSQNFSLEDFHVSIHLANNSVQKNFENDKVRDKRLPEENMWSSDEFKSYLRKKGLEGKWSNVIYPGMKQAVIYAMESCQEIVEYRKNSFELYGADFIIGDDFKPWLIEINCSPTMGASTGVTRKLCAQVVEDTMKVVLDRREDRNCDTGRFELAFKQAHVSAPPYIGVNLAVEGQGIPRKASVTRRPSTSSKVTNVARPRDTRANMNESKTTRTSTIESRDVKNNANESRNTRNSLNESREFKSIRDASRDRIISPNKAISQSSSSSETFQDKLDVKRHNHKTDKNPNLEPRNNIKKAEGSWALGQLQIPKRLRARSRSGTYGDTKGQGQGVPKGAQPMSIPKAILRYSTDQRNEPQKPQIPISIGPSH